MASMPVLLVFFLEFNTVERNKREKTNTYRLNKLLTAANFVCWPLVKIYLTSRITPGWGSNMSGYFFADRQDVLATCSKTFLKSFLSLQHPTEHVPVVKSRVLSLRLYGLIASTSL